ncbi:MAG: DUF2130 domain-containing protein [Acidobacteria bacterium]|nr:DUF2130 domain-containing protein [Acidobacteriota bacterium]
MGENLIACPKCGHEFAVSEVQSARVRAEVEVRLTAEHDKRLKSAVRQAELRAREGLTLELEDLRIQLTEQQSKTRKAEEQELALRKRSRELEEKQQKLDIEIERRLEQERKTIETRLRNQLDEKQALKLKEKERQIEDLREALEEARRRSQQGSQERQGEVLELDIEAALREHFPHDDIRPVPKGMRGADLIQEVRNSYTYLSGDEFRHRVEAIVEAFSAMQGQLQKERRAMERLWQEREKQIERIITNTAGMYGAVRGLIGAGMPEVQMLTLEAAGPEEKAGE